MEIGLHNLKNPFKKAKKRVGRGESSGYGKTSGKGHKGQKARGNDMPRGFEGGQTPLKWRLPKLKGFKRNVPKKMYVLTLSQIEKAFSDREIVSPETLKEKGLIKNEKFLVKIIKKKLKIKNCLLSSGAKRALKIEQ